MTLEDRLRRHRVHRPADHAGHHQQIAAKRLRRHVDAAADHKEPVGLPALLDEKFKLDLPKWEAAMNNRTRTASQIIATVQTKYILSPEQIKTIQGKEPKQ